MLEKVLGEIEFDMDTQILAYEMLLYQLTHTDIYPAAVTYAELTNLKKMVASTWIPLLSRNAELQNFSAMFRR